jgi:hypothetical protein
MKRTNRAALSQVAVAVLATVLVGAVVAGALLAAAPSRNAVSSSSSATTSTGAPIHTTSSHDSFTHSTLVHNGTATATVPSYTANTIPGTHPAPHFLFGAMPSDTLGNYPASVIPADTLTWTNWVMNGTTHWFIAATQPLTGPQADFNMSYTDWNVTAGIYLNGKLAGHATYRVSAYNEGLGIDVPRVSNTTIPAGTVVSLAIVSTIPLTQYFIKNMGTPTFQAPLDKGSALPLLLPSANSSLPNTMLMWAYYLA